MDEVGEENSFEGSTISKRKEEIEQRGCRRRIEGNGDVYIIPYEGCVI